MNINNEDIIIENAYRQNLKLKDLLDASSRITNTSMFVYDFENKKMIYKTDKLLFADEATLSDLQRESSVPYWSLIVKEDIEAMLDIKDAYYRILKTLEINQKSSHTLVINYHIITQHKKYMVTQKFTPLQFKPDGTPLIGLYSICPCTHESNELAAVFGTGFRYKYEFDKKIFALFTNNIELTLMEKAILLCVSRGLSIEQISEDLNRSVNTIKTHRKRLFKKLAANSMSEVITIVDNYNLY